MRTLEEIKARIKEIKRLDPEGLSDEQGEAIVKELEDLTRNADQLLKIELENKFGAENAVLMESLLRGLVGLPPALSSKKEGKSFTDLD